MGFGSRLRCDSQNWMAKVCALGAYLLMNHAVELALSCTKRVMKPDLRTFTVLQLRAQFEGSAEEHGQATRNRNSAAANRAYALIAASAAELQRRGAEGRAVLVGFLTDPSPAVRVWAAAEVLFFEPSLAERTLELIGAGPLSPEGLSALYTLKEWRAGRLRPPSAFAEKGSRPAT